MIESGLPTSAGYLNGKESDIGTRRRSKTESRRAIVGATKTSMRRYKTDTERKRSEREREGLL